VKPETGGQLKSTGEKEKTKKGGKKWKEGRGKKEGAQLGSKSCVFFFFFFFFFFCRNRVAVCCGKRKILD
jgi:hypothetical protein